MSDFPHVLENLLDSEQAAAIVKVHPKTLQRYARNALCADCVWESSGGSALPISFLLSSARRTISTTTTRHSRLDRATRARNQRGEHPC